MTQILLTVQSKRFKTGVFLLCILIYALIFAVVGYSKIPHPNWEVTNDAVHYLVMANNLQEHGVFSLSVISNEENNTELLKRTALREPGYPALLSLGMLLSPSFKGLSDENIRISENRFILPSKDLGYFEMFVLFLLSLLSMWAAYSLTGNRVLSIVVLFGVGFSPAFLVNIRQLLTENLTALFLLGSSFALYNLIKNKNKKSSIILGILLGMLTLTRAIFQFAWFPLVGFISLHHFFKGVAPKKIAVIIVLFLSSYFAVVTPWLVRNYINFDRAFISQRGGLTLKHRANYNMMTAKEYFAFFIYWTPTRHTEKVLYKLFDYDDIKRLDLNNSHSYFKESISTRNELIKKHGDIVKADSVLISMALEDIKSHPFRHLLTCIPLAWKGSFVEIDNHFLLPATLISLLLFLGFFGFVLWSIIKREWEYIAFIFLSIYMFSMHVLLSWCNPRHNKPLIPILWISSMFFIYLFYKKLLPRLQVLISPISNSVKKDIEKSNAIGQK